jgi:hypothetical protein
MGCSIGRSPGRPLQDLVDVDGCTTELVRQARSIGHEAPGLAENTPD